MKNIKSIMVFVVLFSFVGLVEAAIITQDSFDCADNADINACNGVGLWNDSLNYWSVVNNTAYHGSYWNIRLADTTYYDGQIQINLSRNNRILIYWYVPTESQSAPASGYYLKISTSSYDLYYANNTLIDNVNAASDGWSSYSIETQNSSGQGLKLYKNGTLLKSYTDSDEISALSVYPPGGYVIIGSSNGDLVSNFDNYSVASLSSEAVASVPTDCSAGAGISNFTSYNAENPTRNGFGRTIFLETGNKTLCNVYFGVNDTSIVNYYSNNTYLINATIFIDYTANLSINDTTLKIINVGENTTNYNRIHNRGGLNISNATISSIGNNTNIYGDVRYGYNSQWQSITNSTIDHLGSDYHVDFDGNPVRAIDSNANYASSLYEIKNNIFTNNSQAILRARTTSTGSQIINNTFYDVLSSTLTGNNGMIDISMPDSNFSYNTISGLRGVSGGGAVLLIEGGGYSNTTIWYNSFLNNSGVTVRTKHANNQSIMHNIFNGGNTTLDLQKGYHTDTPNYKYGDTFENNTISNYSAGEGNIVQASGTSLTGNIIRNNTITLSATLGSTFYLQGVSDLIFENNVNNNTNVVTYNGMEFTSGTFWGVYNNSINLTVKNNTFINLTSMGIKVIEDQINESSVFVDNSWDSDWLWGSFSYDVLPGFINNKIVAGTIGGTPSYYHEYYYIDINVTNGSGNPISGATVVITNVSYPTINIEGDNTSTTTTGIDGHIPLPSNTSESIAGLNATRYSISVSKTGYNTNSSVIIIPDSSLYRLDPNTPTYTTQITLEEATESEQIQILII